jgi:hypothetical protein
MKQPAASLVLLAAVALASGSVEAAGQQKKGAQASRAAKTPSAQTQVEGQRGGASGRSGDYYENVIDSQPVGSQRWWDVYDRQRGSPH